MSTPIRATLRRFASVGFAAGWMFVAAAFASDAEPGFAPLIDRLDGEVVDFVGAPSSTWSLDDNVLRCSGVPNGYIATIKPYRNFILRLEFRYARPPDLQDDAAFPGNSGYLLYITGEPKVWPQCVEVQGRNRDVGRIIAIGGATPVTAADKPETRQRVLRPVGEWNSMEIRSQDGAVTAILNGEVVCTSEAGPLREGPIGLQSEGREIHFRAVRIKTLP